MHKKICFKIIISVFFVNLNTSLFATEFNLNKNFFNNLNLSIIEFKSTSPLYKNIRSYKCYNLKDILNKVKYNKSKYDVLTFIAKDDFKISIPILFIDKYISYIAIKDLSLKDSRDWEIVRDGGRILDAGPYYLMWKSTDPIPNEYWAFGVVKIQFSNMKEAYGNAIPPSQYDENIIMGFQIYQKSCSACHSINLNGGDLGVEMNVPKNFTEYYSNEYIINYAQSPTSYRANAKMPSINLIQKEIELFLSYLKVMKNNKICNKNDECQKMLDQKLLINKHKK